MVLNELMVKNMKKQEVKDIFLEEGNFTSGTTVYVTEFEKAYKGLKKAIREL